MKYVVFLVINAIHLMTNIAALWKKMWTIKPHGFQLSQTQPTDHLVTKITNIAMSMGVHHLLPVGTCASLAPDRLVTVCQSIVGNAKYSLSERSLSNNSSTLNKLCAYRNFINSNRNNQAYCNVLLYPHFVIRSGWRLLDRLCDSVKRQSCANEVQVLTGGRQWIGAR